MWFPFFNQCDRNRRDDFPCCRFWDNLMFIHCSCDDDYDVCDMPRRREFEEQEVKCFKIKDKHDCKCHKKDHHHRDCGCKKHGHPCGCHKKNHQHKCNCPKCKRNF
jgi:hypothetical protein